MAEPFEITLISVEFETPDRAFLIGGGKSNGLAFVQNTTTYLALANAGTGSTTESFKQAPLGIPGRASNLWIYVSANSLFSVSASIKLRKNGAPTSLAISLAPGITGVKEDTANQVYFTATDQLGIEVFVPFDEENPSAAFTMRNHSLLIQGDTATVHVLGGDILGGDIL